ncbi:MAG: type IVB secretion system protein IcmH/DotU [Endozoicomonas sp.]
MSDLESADITQARSGHLIPAGTPLQPFLQEMIPILTGNPYINEAIPLLLLITSLQRLDPPTSIATYHKHLLNHLVLYRKKLLEQDGTRATFVLAATLDELTMQSEWSASDWIGETLCSRLFKRRDSGRQFFQIVKGWLKSPQDNIEPLLLAYLCIKLGFRGQFRYRNQDVLDSLQVSLYHLLLQEGQLNKMPLGFDILESDIHPVRSAYYRRSALILAGLISLLVAVGGSWIFSQKESSVESLRQASIVTSYPTQGYRRATPEEIHELIFQKQKY